MLCFNVSGSSTWKDAVQTTEKSTDHDGPRIRIWMVKYVVSITSYRAMDSLSMQEQQISNPRSQTTELKVQKQQQLGHEADERGKILCECHCHIVMWTCFVWVHFCPIQYGHTSFRCLYLFECNRFAWRERERERWWDGAFVINDWSSSCINKCQGIIFKICGAAKLVLHNLLSISISFSFPFLIVKIFILKKIIIIISEKLF